MITNIQWGSETLSESLISNGQALAMAIDPAIQKLDHLSEFQMVGLSDFRSHSKSGPNLFSTIQNQD